MADPQQIIQSQTTIPDYARPYVEGLLGQTAGVLYNYAKDAQGNVVKDASGMPVITGFNPMAQYGGERTAQFTDLQKQAFTGAQSLGQNQYSQTAASGMQGAAQKALDYGYDPSKYGSAYSGPADYRAGQFNANQVQAPQLQQYQMQGPGNVQGAVVQAAGNVGTQNISTRDIQAAQTGYSPNLQTFQMGPAERVNTQTFAQPGSAESFMSPYMQSVVAAQQREAERASNIQRTQNQAQAVKAGAFGGSRQAIVEAERQRNLALQKGDIQSAGLQSAYQQAQQQFNAEQQARLLAQQSNQQAGLTVGQQNLNAQLGIQQLGTQVGAQMALANLSNEQQAAVQNEANRLQASGMNAQQSMQAALANQQTQQQANLANQQTQQQANLANQAMGYNVNNANLNALLAQQQLGSGQNMQAQLANQQSGLTAQQLAEQSRQYGYGQSMTNAAIGAQYGQAANQLNEQSRQYGAGLGLQGLQAGMAGYTNLGAMGNQLYNQQAGALNLQQQLGTQQQQQTQNVLNTQYQDFLNQQNHPYKQLSYMSDMLRGVPLTQQSQSIYQAPPSALSQVAGFGTAVYAADKAFGKKKGGRIPGAGLADLALEKIGQE